MCKASSDNKEEDSKLEDDAITIAARIDNLAEEVFDEKHGTWESSGEDDDMKNIVCLRNTLKAMRIFEMTLTEDQYIAPEFE